MSKSIIEKREILTAALSSYMDRIKSGEDLRPTISTGNSKMGYIPSFSTLPLVTCPARCEKTCGAACYALKLAMLRPSVLSSYAKNTALVLMRPAETWRHISDAMHRARFFRFHVSGDIMSKDYFNHMIAAVRENPHCTVLCFTKRYEIVNAWIRENGALPENLRLIMSAWENLKPINPHGLPESNVIMSGQTAPESWKKCCGNCETCTRTHGGCWDLKAGETIGFHIH